MKGFDNPLIVEKLEKDYWLLWVPFTFHSCTGKQITVPVGTITDFASVPTIFQGFIPKAGPWAQATILHDYLYSTQRYDRKTCDDLFLEAMEVLNVTPWKKNVMYLAVRVFGSVAYKKGGSDV